LLVVSVSAAGAEETRTELEKLRYWRQRALKLAAQIESEAQREHALSLIESETGDLVDPVNLEAAITLIANARTPAVRRKLLRKLVRESKFQSELGRPLTTNESKRIEEVFGVDGRPGVTLLAMIYMDVGLDKVRVAHSLRLLESAPAGKWRDAAYFSAMHVLLARHHVASELKDGILQLDIRKVPTSFVTLSQDAVQRIEDTKLRDWGQAMIAMAAMTRGRRDVDLAMKHVDQISLGDLRDTIRFQGITVLLTGKTSDEEVLEVKVSPDEIQLFTSHHE
jgi:hypothetical protein